MAVNDGAIIFEDTLTILAGILSIPPVAFEVFNFCKIDTILVVL